MNTEVRELTDRELDVVTGAKGNGVIVSKETTIETEVGTLRFGIETRDGVPYPYSRWKPA